MIEYCGTGTCGRCGVCTRFAKAKKERRIARVQAYLDRLKAGSRYGLAANRKAFLVNLLLKSMTKGLNPLEKRYRLPDYSEIPWFWNITSRR